MTQHSLTLAKTTRPRVSAVLDRERLFARLDGAREQAAAWIAGPPGAGKTTLAASYLSARGVDHLWYQIDAGDADVASFFHYLSDAAVRHLSGVKASPPERFRPGLTDDIGVFARAYFRDLFARPTAPWILVLDNYQAVPAQSPLHQALLAGLHEVPSRGCVFCVSRKDPGPEMARLRANGRMEVLGWDELRLTIEEQAAIAELRNRPITGEALAAIHERTRGWVAGLVLMLEHGKLRGEPIDLPPNSPPRLVFDYLAGEIFDCFGAEERAFLLDASLLPRLTPGMARELTGYAQAEALLRNLARNDYFVSDQHGPGGVIYEFHPLFREFLQTLARETHGDPRRTELARRAATLLDAAGEPERAIDLLLGIGDSEVAAGLIRDQAQPMLLQGRTETLARWLDELPGDAFEADPWLRYWSAACEIHHAPRESRRRFEQAYLSLTESAEAEPRAMLMCACGVIDATLHEQDDYTRLDRWIECLTGLLDAYPALLEADAETRVMRTLLMAYIMRAPSGPVFRRCLARARELFEDQHNQDLKVSLGALLAVAAMWSGGFRAARELLTALATVERGTQLAAPALAVLRNVESMYRMLLGERDACLDAVRAGLELHVSQGVTVWGNQLLANAVGACLVDADPEGADEWLQRLEAWPLSHTRMDRCRLHYFSAWRAIVGDDVVTAYREQRRAEQLASELGVPLLHTLCRLGLAQALAGCGDQRKARGEIKIASTTADTADNPLLAYTCGLGAALVALDLDDRDRAGGELRKAFALAREHGFNATLWWRPASTARLCVLALEQGIEPDYVRGLIRERDLAPEGSPVDVAEWPWAFRVKVLGGFELCREDESQTLAGRPLELLKVIIAFGGKDVRAEQVTEALWPHVDGDYAYRSFSTALHRLRKLLGRDDAVLLADGRVGLAPSLFWVDAWALEQVIVDLDATLRPGRIAWPDAETVAGLGEKFMALNRGNFLDQDVEQLCYIAHREHLRRRAFRAIARLAGYWEQADDRERAIDCYQRAIEADRLYEGNYRELMHCLRRAGRFAEALDVYELCRTTLASLLQAEPSAETQALRTAIADGEPDAG